MISSSKTEVIASPVHHEQAEASAYKAFFRESLAGYQTIRLFYRVVGLPSCCGEPLYLRRISINRDPCQGSSYSTPCFGLAVLSQDVLKARYATKLAD